MCRKEAGSLQGLSAGGGQWKNGTNQGQSWNKAKVDSSVKTDARKRVTELLEKYPLYKELDLEYLEKSFPYSK